MSDKRQSGGVKIGNVEGGIHGSIFAGRDVKGATITLGGQQMSADKEPTVEEFQQLLSEIRKELAELAAQRDALKEVSPAAPSIAQGAEASIEEVAARTEEPSGLKPEEAKSVQESLTEATGLLNNILAAAEKAVEVGKSVKPFVKQLTPLAEKVGIAAFWAAKLWLL
jgi:hypothetical protein